MSKSKFVLYACAFAWLFAIGPMSWAQGGRATLGGRVTDAQGAMVPGADVVVTSDDTQVKQQTKTNGQGNWAVNYLLPGAYTFSITAPGFRPVERHGVALQTGDYKQIDTQLEVGAATTEVTVTGEVPLIDTTAAVSGTVVTREEILEMPSMSRVSTLLATLSPGVMAQDQNQNVAHAWSHDAASQFTVDGGRNNTRSNNFELDGMPNLKTGGQVAFIPAPDAIQEFRVVLNAYDAAIGRQAGGTIQMTLKNGTNQLHGSLYEFNQNNILNANLFQTNLTGGSKAPVHYNEYGGTIGGPVWIPKVYNGKEKTFFFFNYNGIRNADPRYNTRSVPTELERTGDFSQSYTTQLVNGQRVNYPIQVFDPLSVQNDANGTRTLFPGMVIPISRMSKVAQNILKYVPLPNTATDGTTNATNNFVPNSTRQNKMADVTVRGDHTWNNNHKSFATVRWYHEDELASDDFHNAFTGTYQHRMTKGAGVDHVWTISPTKVLDVKGNLTRYEEPNNDNGVGFDSSTLGLPSSFTSQLFVPAAPRITGLFGDIGTNQAGSVTDTSYYTWSALLTQVKGNMTLKYGAEYWVLQEADKNIGNEGRFDFGSEWTRQQALVSGGIGNGSTLGSFLLGLPHNSNSSFPVNANSFWSQHYSALYFQDDWRVTPKLTINLGLRWDVETPVTDRYNRVTSVYDMNAVNPVSGAAQAAYGAMLSDPKNSGNPGIQILQQVLPASAFKVMGAQLFNGVNGVPRGTYNMNYTQFQPRAGFAYQLGPHTVLRGGFGRFTQASFITEGQNGFSRSTALDATNDNYKTYYDTLDNPYRNGILAPTGSSLGALTNLGQGVNWSNPDPGRAYSWEYSLHLQHQIKSWLLELGYTHNKTYDLAWGLNENLPSFALWQKYLSPANNFDGSGRPLDTLLWNTLVPNPFKGLPNVTGSIATNSTIAMNQLLNPVAILGGITEDNNPWGKNQYDAMLVKVEHRFSKGFSVLNSFTWSKLFEDTSWTGPEIAGRNVEHKLGGEDRPFHLSVAPIWNMPIGRGQKLGANMNKVLDAFIGGWQLAGQFNIQSGVPVAFVNSSGTPVDAFFSGQDFALPKGKQSLSQWFDTSQFLRFPAKNTDISTYPAWTGIQSLPGYSYVPAPGDTIKNGVYQDFATYIRNYPTRWGDVRASRVNNVDAVISKSFRIREKVRMQYRFETYNLFNHVRFGGPNADPTSSSFGTVAPTEQNNARLVQMALKLYF
jgi:Carboxypeptidase regulatory-like domain/TonB dependent receptor-like, beta-barrel